MRKQRQVGAIKSFHRNTSADCPLFYAKTHGRIHSLSHDTVEIMIKKYSKNGMPLAHIQQLLGHENMSTTSGFYAFATIETLSKSTLFDEKLFRYFGAWWPNSLIQA